MFEVGKKYLFNQNKTHYECFCVGQGWALLSNNPTEPFLVHEDSFRYYKEYKEPRTITRWINVYEVKDELSFGLLAYETKEEAIGRTAKGMTIIDTIQVSYTEPH